MTNQVPPSPASAVRSELTAFIEKLKSAPSPDFISPLSIDELLVVEGLLQTYYSDIETRVDEGLKDEHYEEYNDKTISEQDFEKVLDDAIDKRYAILQGEGDKINYIRDKIKKFMETQSKS